MSESLEVPEHLKSTVVMLQRAFPLLWEVTDLRVNGHGPHSADLTVIPTRGALCTSANMSA